MPDESPYLRPIGWRLYELINPSDPYTFYAPDNVTAGLAVALLSTRFGASLVDGDDAGWQSPVLFGWKEWNAENVGDVGAWLTQNKAVLVTVWRTMLIGKVGDRRTLEDMLACVPVSDHARLMAIRHDRERSSMNDIGAYARNLADRLELPAPSEERDGICG